MKTQNLLATEEKAENFPPPTNLLQRRKRAFMISDAPLLHLNSLPLFLVNSKQMKKSFS
jgi:hypothetical protein